MHNEEHLIKEQMEQKRVDLADKIETLESTLMGTVQDTLKGASDVVKSVEHTVESVTDSVQDSVAAVKETVAESVEAVKETFNLTHHVERHPWAMMGGAVLLGFLGGRMLSRIRPQGTRRRRRRGAAPVTAASAASLGSEMASSAGRSAEREQPAEEGSSWFSQLGSTFGDELAKLKGLAVGATIGVLRDMVTSAAPEQFKPQLKEVMNNITTKLGGHTFDKPLIDTSNDHSSPDKEDRNGHGSHSETGRPAGATA